MTPVDYCEESPKKKKRPRSPKGLQKQIAEVKGKIQIKSECITHLKKAIYILNIEHDKRKIADLDVEEYIILLDDGDYTPPCTNDAGPSNLLLNHEDDCIEVNRRRPAPQMSTITTGISKVMVDRDFSLEYSYTTKVRQIIY